MDFCDILLPLYCRGLSVRADKEEEKEGKGQGEREIKIKRDGHTRKRAGCER